MRCFKFPTPFVFFMACLMYSTPVMAIPVVWTVQNVTFNDGGTAIGSFTFDADNVSFSIIKGQV